MQDERNPVPDDLPILDLEPGFLPDSLPLTRQWIMQQSYSGMSHGQLDDVVAVVGVVNHAVRHGNQLLCTNLTLIGGGITLRGLATVLSNAELLAEAHAYGRLTMDHDHIKSCHLFIHNQKQRSRRA